MKRRGVGVHGYLIRYRVLAFTTATLLIILVLIGVPLQLLTGQTGLVNTVGTIHGFLYLVYLVVAFQLARKLEISRPRLLLVLLAGTVPFCAFIAERKLTKRYNELFPSVGAGSSHAAPLRAGDVRRRWFSRRALLLHAEVLVVAPGCAAAGWWQATRALAGNGLSWVYSVEWPIFAILAVVGWWRLIHESPEAYRARKQGDTGESNRDGSVTTDDAAVLLNTPRSFDNESARIAKRLAVMVAIEFAVGIVTLALITPSRPSGFLPSRWPEVYLLHAALGLPLAAGAVAFFLRVRTAPRISRLSGWFGVVGIGAAGAGGIATAVHALRLFGIIVMFIGTTIALFGYLFPTLEKLDVAAPGVGTSSTELETGQRGPDWTESATR